MPLLLWGVPILLLVGLAHRDSLRAEVLHVQEEANHKCSASASETERQLTAASQQVEQVLAELALRKRDAEAYAAAEKLYRPLFTDNPQPMYVFDLRTLRLVLANETALAQYGYDLKEFLSLTIGGLVGPENVSDFLKESGGIAPGSARP